MGRSGREGWFGRHYVWFPVLALNLWLIVATLRKYQHGAGESWVDVDFPFYPVAAITMGILFLAPVLVAWGAFSAERRAGTLDALLLLPVDRRPVVLGYAMRAARPWLALMAASLPIHVIICWAASTQEPEMGGLFALVSKPVLLAALWFKGESLRFEPNGHAAQLLWMVPVSMANDFALLAFGIAVGLKVSLQVRSGISATLAALARGTLPMVTVLSLESWTMVLALGGGDQYIFQVCVATVLLVWLRGLAVGAQLGELALNFDHHALAREHPP